MGTKRDGFDQIKYQNEYNKQKYDTILVTLPKGKKDIVKERAAALGKSVNGYINDMINMDIREI